MLEILVFMSGILIYRWFCPHVYKRHNSSQTVCTQVHVGIQTETLDDSMSLDLSDMDIDDDFFTLP